MDDEQYRQAREAIEQPRCRYEKAIQYGYFQCQWHQRFALGERESLHCTQPSAFKLCDEFHTLTLSHSGFALGTAKMPMHLSFNQAMKVQIGGLRGVMHQAGKPVIEPEMKSATQLQDVADELEQLKVRVEGEFGNMDFSEITPYISEFSLRKRRK